MEEDDANVIDFDRICRLCVREKRILMEIFESSLDNNNLTIDQKIMACADVDLSKDDGLPTKICIKCLSNVNAAFDFRIQCENADKALRGIHKLSVANQINLVEGVEGVEVEKNEEGFEELELEGLQQREAVKVGSVKIIKSERKRMEDKDLCGLLNVARESETAMRHAGELTAVLIGEAQEPIASGEASGPPVEVAGMTNCDETPNAISFTIRGSSQETYRVIINPPKEAAEVGMEGSKCRTSRKKDVGRVGKSPCPFCNKMLARVDAHVRLLHRNRVYVCTKLDCGAKFLTLKNLQSHQLTCYDVEKAYKCFSCFKEFHRKSNYKAHVKRHSDVKDFQCQLCDRAFVDSTGLRRHFLKHHEPRQETFVGGCCGKRFKSKEGLKKHVQKGICGIQLLQRSGSGAGEGAPRVS